MEAAFPLREASLDSSHEKDVRHGADLYAAHVIGAAGALSPWRDENEVE